MSWPGVDCRTYTYALRDRCSGVILLIVRLLRHCGGGAAFVEKKFEQTRDLRANHRIESLLLDCACCEHHEIELSPSCMLFHHRLRPPDSFRVTATRICSVHQ